MYFLKYQVPCHQGSPCFYVNLGSQGSIQSGVKHGSLILALLIVCSVALCKLFKLSWSLPAFISFLCWRHANRLHLIMSVSFLIGPRNGSV